MISLLCHRQITLVWYKGNYAIIANITLPVQLIHNLQTHRQTKTYATEKSLIPSYWNLSSSPYNISYSKKANSVHNILLDLSSVISIVIPNFLKTLKTSIFLSLN